MVSNAIPLPPPMALLYNFAVHQRLPLSLIFLLTAVGAASAQTVERLDPALDRPPGEPERGGGANRHRF